MPPIERLRRRARGKEDVREENHLSVACPKASRTSWSRPMDHRGTCSRRTRSSCWRPRLRIVKEEKQTGVLDGSGNGRENELLLAMQKRMVDCFAYRLERGWGLCSRCCKRTALGRPGVCGRPRPCTGRSSRWRSRGSCTERRHERDGGQTKSSCQSATASKRVRTHGVPEEHMVCRAASATASCDAS